MSGKQEKPKIAITGIFVQDPIDKGYTGFFSEIPEAVSEGDTIEEAVSNLLEVLPFVLQSKSEMLQEENLIEGTNEHYIRKSFEFELS